MISGARHLTRRARRISGATFRSPLCIVQRTLRAAFRIAGGVTSPDSKRARSLQHALRAFLRNVGAIEELNQYATAADEQHTGDHRADSADLLRLMLRALDQPPAPRRNGADAADAGARNVSSSAASSYDDHYVTLNFDDDTVLKAPPPSNHKPLVTHVTLKPQTQKKPTYVSPIWR